MFQYKIVKGPLHRVPALAKFLLLLPLSIVFMSLSPLCIAAGILAACLIAFLCKFTLREQIIDLKPAVLYAFLMYALSVFSVLIDKWHAFPDVSFSSVFIPHPDFLRISLRLVLIIQLSSLLFRTTSSGEIRDALFTVENGIRRIFSSVFFQKKHRGTKNMFSEYISLFLSFIPEIFENWALVNMAWKARGGKKGFAKIKSLVFILISLSMEKAALKAKALEARK
jgi:biotin transport system permease protein/energy-coupling factor transport system permease protein